MKDEVDFAVALNRVGQELQAIKVMMQQVVNFIRDAESEIPEKMRRYMNYMHDVHDISYMYEEKGIDVPPHVLRELERLDDRYRQLLKDMNAEGGAFNKVRRTMADDVDNRWDHQKFLTAQTEKADEARTGAPLLGPDESGAEAEGN